MIGLWSWTEREWSWLIFLLNKNSWMWVIVAHFVWEVIVSDLAHEKSEFVHLCLPILLRSHILIKYSICWEKILITEKQIHCQVHFKMKIANWILFVKGFCRHQRCKYESVLSTSIFEMTFLWDYLPISFKIHITLK